MRIVNICTVSLLAILGWQSGSVSVRAAAAADDVPGVIVVKPGEAGIAVLLERAQFWYSKGNAVEALALFNRVLSLRPDNTQALIGVCKVALDSGHADEARAPLERLRKISPNDPFLASLDAMRQRSPEDVATVAEARRLNAAGRKVEAIAKYQSVFRGKPVPADLAAEYYPYYISTLPEDSDEAANALAELGKIADAHPDDATLQLADAQAMVFLAGSRADGIDKLHQLSHVPAVAAQARQIWHEALLWQGPDFQARDQLKQYLAENPSDAKLEAKLADYNASLPNPGQLAKMEGYEAINVHDTQKAERLFQLALDDDPNDPDAVVMMALTRQLQGRKDEWRALLDKAIALAPERKAEFENMLGLEAQRAIVEQYKEVETLAAARKFDAAEALLRKLIGDQKNPGSLIQLAELQIRAGKSDAAIATLNSVLAMQASNPDAHFALASLHAQRRQFDLALQHYTQAQLGYEAAGNAQGVASVHEGRAEVMTSVAAVIADPAKREAALRKAWAENPQAWWVRLYLARAIYAQGRRDDANKLIRDAETFAQSPGALTTRYGRDALQVAEVWADERGDSSAALKWSLLMPAADRSPSMLEVISREGFKKDFQNAKALGEPAATQRLLELAAAPDSYGNRCAAIARDFLKRQNVQDAKQALQLGLQATRPATVQQKLTYAELYIAANDVKTAQALLSSVDRAKLNPSEDAAYANTTDAIVLANAESLLDHHQNAQALTMLNARLAEHPGNQALQIGVDRAQIALGSADAPLADTLKMLDRDKTNLPARHTAIEAATALNKTALAAQLTRDGLQITPDDLFLNLQAADQARRDGRLSESLLYLRQARGIRNPSN